MSEQLREIRNIIDGDKFQKVLSEYNALPEVVKVHFRHRFYQFHGYYGKGFFDFIKEMDKIKIK